MKTAAFLKVWFLGLWCSYIPHLSPFETLKDPRSFERSLTVRSSPCSFPLCAPLRWLPPPWLAFYRKRKTPRRMPPPWGGCQPWGGARRESTPCSTSRDSSGPRQCSGGSSSQQQRGHSGTTKVEAEKMKPSRGEVWLSYPCTAKSKTIVKNAWKHMLGGSFIFLSRSAQCALHIYVSEFANVCRFLPSLNWCHFI